jgi:hypothetical protein
MKLTPLTLAELEYLEPQLPKLCKSVDTWGREIQSMSVDRYGKVVVDEWTTNYLIIVYDMRESAQRRVEEVIVRLSVVRKRVRRLTTARESCLRRYSVAKYPKLYEKVLYGLPVELRNYVYQHIAGDSMTLFKASFHEEVFSLYYRHFPIISKSCNDDLNEYIASTKAAGPLFAHEAAKCFHRETAVQMPAVARLPLFISTDDILRNGNVMPAHLIRNITLSILPEDYTSAAQRRALASNIGALHTMVNKTATITI